MYAHIYLDVLDALLGAGDFPASILRVTAENILQLFEEGNGLELVLESSNIDVLGIQRKARFSQDQRKGDGMCFCKISPRRKNDLISLYQRRPLLSKPFHRPVVVFYGLHYKVLRRTPRTSQRQFGCMIWSTKSDGPIASRP